MLIVVEWVSLGCRELVKKRKINKCLTLKPRAFNASTSASTSSLKKKFLRSKSESTVKSSKAATSGEVSKNLDSIYSQNNILHYLRAYSDLRKNLRLYYTILKETDSRATKISNEDIYISIEIMDKLLHAAKHYSNFLNSEVNKQDAYIHNILTKLK